MTEQSKGHLPRLGPEAYRGQAYVHWTMTVQDRRTGWLIPAFMASGFLAAVLADIFIFTKERSFSSKR